MALEKTILQPPSLTGKDVIIHRKTRLFSKHFAVDEYLVSYKTFKGPYTKKLIREVFEKDQNAVAVLPYDPVTDEVVLIEQFRPGALKDPLSPWILEVTAGMVDDGESEIDTALRELEEETRLKAGIRDLCFINRVYSSPGASSEKVTLYLAMVDASNLESYGGLESENEDIRIFKVKAAEAFDLVKSGRINNAITLICLMYLENNHKKFLQKPVAEEKAG